MDGTHDLGGRQGFGAADVDEPEEAFHEPWEGRVLGMVRAMSRPADWSIDWFRHCRELIEPTDYLTRPYYDQWLQTYAAMMVNSGVATVEELASGKAKTPVSGLPPPMTASDVDEAKRAHRSFEREIGEPPVFAVGDEVRVKSHGVPGHTRLPAYARRPPGHRRGPPWRTRFPRCKRAWRRTGGAALHGRFRHGGIMARRRRPTRTRLPQYVGGLP